MIIQSKNVWSTGCFLPAQLVVEGETLARVAPYGEAPPDFDYGEARIVPGFIDEHTHGAYGFDTNDGTAEGLQEWLRRAPGEGVTALLPTTITHNEQVLTAALSKVAAVAKSAPAGAEIAGVHLEGPFLSLAYKGAHTPEFITPPSVEQFVRYQSAAEGLIRLITLAPEEDEGHALIRHCVQNGVTVNMGHTSCTYEQAMAGVASGVGGATHTFNAMTPLNHRLPGTVGAVLRCGELYGEIIADGIHSHFASLGIFFAAKGPHRGVMITDSLLVKGADPDNAYTLGGQEIILREDGGAAMLKSSGSLAGSALRFHEGLRNLVEKALIPFESALNACTINPARHLGLDKRKGKLSAGYDADIVVLADDYSVTQTFCRGIACL